MKPISSSYNQTKLTRYGSWKSLSTPSSSAPSTPDPSVAVFDLPEQTEHHNLDPKQTSTALDHTETEKGRLRRPTSLTAKEKEDEEEEDSSEAIVPSLQTQSPTTSPICLSKLVTRTISKQNRAASPLQTPNPQSKPPSAILRDFDLNSTYGPCVGITRLERWCRASKLGLDPPADVMDLLCKVQVVPEKAKDGVWSFLEGRV